MDAAKSRLLAIASQLLPSTNTTTGAVSTDASSNNIPAFEHRYNHHTLSPTNFLPRAAAIEPDALCCYHKTSNGAVLKRSYAEVADRARGFAYWIRKKGYKRVCLLATNTPCFLETIFAIPAAGAVQISVNYRLKREDIAYICRHSGADLVVVDKEFEELLGSFREGNPHVPVLVDLDTDRNEGEYDRAVLEGLEYDRQMGGKGWAGLQTQVENEEDVIALAYTSGTTANPKGVEYTHRGAYLATLGNVIESGLSFHNGRCKYLWTLPMFHACGWTFPWAVTAARGTHYCLRKIDYPEIWRLLKDEGITHFNAAPTVNTLLCSDSNADKLPQEVRVTVAAAPPSAHLFEQMTNLNLHPVHVYGLTETYGPITKGYQLPVYETVPVAEKYERMARQGWGFITSLPARVIKSGEDIPLDRLDDVERNGKEIGEIIFTGNICAKGYYKDPEATRKLFAGGVLHTGDLAVWHPDGAIKILDRAKDIIISGTYHPYGTLHHPSFLAPKLISSQAGRTYLPLRSRAC